MTVNELVPILDSNNFDEWWKQNGTTTTTTTNSIEFIISSYQNISTIVHESSQPFFTATTTTTTTTSSGRSNKSIVEESFPPLPSSTQPKRRIRPAQITSSPWNHNNSNSNSNSITVTNHNNISKLPSENTLDMRMTLPFKNDLMIAKKNNKNSTIRKKPTSAVEVIPVTRPAPPTTTTTTTTMKEETKTNVKRMNRLGLLYCTLMKGQYMSSIALELEFLFRLLAISTTTTTTSVLFESSHDCIEFSKQVLNSKEVQSLLSSFGPHFHHPLSHYHENYNLFQLPSSLATTTLKNKIKSTGMKMMIHVEESCANQYSLSVLLTRPFQHTRDSRHAYAKSQELMKQYQNREECRDAFVYQLRYFQDTYFEQHPPQKQHAYKNIFQKLHPSNQPWFANFTCDLLLQIGLLPLEETDQDVLHHIGNDKERLQVNIPVSLFEYTN